MKFRDFLLNESEHTVQPGTKAELITIIEKTIKEKGNKCDLNFIDTSKITDMSGLFKNSKFNGNITEWDTSNVTDMSEMFMGTYYFNQPIGKWNTSKVKNMSGMFCGAVKFNKPIGNWDTSKVTDMTWMFDHSGLKGNEPNWYAD